MTEPLEIARLAADRWNAGDLEGVIGIYAEDAVMHAGPDWPEQRSWQGRDAIRSNMEEWHEVWESSQIEVDSLESHGENVLARGSWNTRGRVSGLDGQMPFILVLVVRDGKIASLEWFTDHDRAVAAARAG